MGSSSRLCAALKPGEPVVVMGPTGTPTEILERRDRRCSPAAASANAVFFSIGKSAACGALARSSTSPAYRKADATSTKVDEIEAASDVIVWSTDVGDRHPRRGAPQDRSFVGNVVQAMAAYANGELGEQAVPYGDGRAHHRHWVGPHDARP